MRAGWALGLALIACGSRTPETQVAPTRPPTDLTDAAQGTPTVGDQPAPTAIVLDGTVVGADGVPAPGAEVSLIRDGEITAHVTADQAGRFHFETVPASWAISAYLPTAVAISVPARAFTGDTRDLRLVLPAPGGATVTVHGKVAAAEPLPSPTFIELSAFTSGDADDTWTVAVDAAGGFTGILPRAELYAASISTDHLRGSASYVPDGDVVDLRLDAAVLAPAPQEVVDWISAHAIALGSADPTTALADLAPVARLVGRSRIVALGEATHGTREFFQLKHRLLELMVEKLGFTAFAIEDDQARCRAINDYIVHGTGDAKTALASLSGWTWRTDEVLAMIEWMRGWNADPRHHRKLQFFGFDMQIPGAAFHGVKTFVDRVAADRSDALLAPIAMLAARDAVRQLASATADQRNVIADALVTVGRVFDAEARSWARATSPGELADARHDLTILEQAVAMYSDPLPGRARDRSMADNVAWILSHQPRGTRIVLWAHNDHVSRHADELVTLGAHLAKRFGKDYLNLGFVFGSGAFNVLDTDTARSTGVFGPIERSVGPAPSSDVSDAFVRAGKPIAVVDLRALPRHGPVTDWFTAPHPMREIGATFSTEDGMARVMRLPVRFDLVAFVATTTAAHAAAP